MITDSKQISYRADDIQYDIPEGCKLIAHHTGDGWLIAVETAGNNEIIAHLAWPKTWPEIITENQLKDFGFEIE